MQKSKICKVDTKSYTPYTKTYISIHKLQNIQYICIHTKYIHSTTIYNYIHTACPKLQKLQHIIQKATNKLDYTQNLQHIHKRYKPHTEYTKTYTMYPEYIHNDTNSIPIIQNIQNATIIYKQPT